MKLSKEMLQEIADSNYDVHDYIFFQEDGSIIYVPEHERDNLVETDGNEVSFSKNTTVYNLSVLLDQTGIDEPKTGGEYIAILNILVDEIENIKHP